MAWPESTIVNYECGSRDVSDHGNRLEAGDQSTERGAVLILTAFIFVALLIVAALVVDIVMIHQAELRAQATADSSVLAAAMDIDDIPAATAQAKDYAARNYGVTDADWASCVDATPLPVVTTVPCISIDDATDPTHIRVRLPDREVPSFFASVLGRDGFSVSAAAIAEIEYITVEDPGAGDPGDPDTPSLRDGDPGGGYPPCENLPNWDDAPADGKKKNWTEFIFVFEHLPVAPATVGETTTICGTTRTDGSGNNVFIPDVGGDSVEFPRGFFMHVSCSDIFTDGWTDAGRFDDTFGPQEGLDPEWRVVRYTMDKYRTDNKTGEVMFQKRCGETFTPITSSPITEPIIRLSL